MRKLRNYFGLVIVLLLLCSMTSDLQKKRIRMGDFDIECYVYLKKIDEFLPGKEYYWFKGGEIHNSLSTAGGQVLHKEYFKYFRSGQMAEKGQFNFGLKDGIWQTWYENGSVKTHTEWSEGFKQGKFMSYDENGEPVQSGQYRNNKPVRTWINHKLRDTVFYKQDSAYAKKPKTKAGILIETIFKPKDSLEKLQLKQEKALKKLERENKKVQDSLDRAKRKLERQNKRVNDSIAKASKKKKSE